MISPLNPMLITGRRAILQELAMNDVDPFGAQVVQSPWHDQVDVEDLHQDVKTLIRQRFERCTQPEARRLLTVIAHAGYGKTHLLSWTRQMMEEAEGAVFVYVPPFRPGQAVHESFEQHLFGELLGTLTQYKQEAFADAVRAFLVTCYDKLVVTSSDPLQDLGLQSSFWTRLLRRTGLQIHAKPQDQQLLSLRQAIACRPFLIYAYHQLEQSYPADAPGLRADRDVFIAASMLACGDPDQSADAYRWFRRELVPQGMQKRFFESECRGLDKIRNAIFTLRKLGGFRFCFALDQLEDTYNALHTRRQPSADGHAMNGVAIVQDSNREFGELMAPAIREIGIQPGCLVLFMFNTSLWNQFSRTAGAWFVDRMVEGEGVQSLQPLSDESAMQLIRRRMDVHVWERFPQLVSPRNQPYFPFTEDLIRKMRLETSGALRPFLERANREYRRMLTPIPEMRLLSLSLERIPAEADSVVTAQIENLADHIRAWVGKLELPATSIERLDKGRIKLKLPPCPQGKVHIRVAAVEDPDHPLSVELDAVAIPKPYCRFVAGKKVRDARDARAISQVKLAELVGSNPNAISRLERELWENAPDELYEKIAAALEVSLGSLLKEEVPAESELLFGEIVE